jgi:hypothetical protein
MIRLMKTSTKSATTSMSMGQIISAYSRPWVWPAARLTVVATRVRFQSTTVVTPNLSL